MCNVFQLFFYQLVRWIMYLALTFPPFILLPPIPVRVATVELLSLDCGPCLGAMHTFWHFEVSKCTTTMTKSPWDGNLRSNFNPTGEKSRIWPLVSGWLWFLALLAATTSKSSRRWVSVWRFQYQFPIPFELADQKDGLDSEFSIHFFVHFLWKSCFFSMNFQTLIFAFN